MKKKKMGIVAGAGVVAVICITGKMMAFAHWYTVGDTNNTLTMASFQNQIVEEYEIPDHVDPGTEIDKIVNVKNTGSADTLIRLSVEKEFGIQKEDGKFETDRELDSDMIQIIYNTAFWAEKEDGYFYYKDILKAGMTTKEPLFTSYTLSEKAGNEYKGKDARIIVRLESIQAEEDAVSLWGVTYEELGITRPEGIHADPTRVVYLGKEEGFNITNDRTDLFAGFKNLLPGCSRTQRIYIENDSDETVEIFLRAASAHQKEMSEKELGLVKQLLEKYAVIEIMQGDEMLYEGPVSGNLDRTRHTMKNDISLGSFIPHNIEELKVKLSLDSDMDNEFLELSGKVKWIFTAKGDDGESISAVHPEKTGLERTFEYCMTVSVLAFLIGAVILLWKRSKKKVCG